MVSFSFQQLQYIAVSVQEFLKHRLLAMSFIFVLDCLHLSTVKPSGPHLSVLGCHRPHDILQVAQGTETCELVSLQWAQT